MGLRSLCIDAVIVNFLINPRDKYKTLISLRHLRRRFLPPKACSKRRATAVPNSNEIVISI